MEEEILGYEQEAQNFGQLHSRYVSSSAPDGTLYSVGYVSPHVDPSTVPNNCELVHYCLPMVLG